MAGKKVSEEDVAAKLNAAQDTETRRGVGLQIRRLETESIKIVWDASQCTYRIYPLTPNAKSLFSLKKIKKGTILRASCDRDLTPTILELQAKVDKLAELFA